MMKDTITNLEEQLEDILYKIGIKEQFPDLDEKYTEGYTKELEGLKEEKERIIKEIMALIDGGHFVLNNKREKVQELIKNSNDEKNTIEEIEKIYGLTA